MEYLQLYVINVNFPKMISALYPDIQLIRTPEDVLQSGVFSIKEQNVAYTYEEFQDYFKGEFDFLRKGITLCGHTMYFDLAGKTEVIYKKITGEE